MKIQLTPNDLMAILKDKPEALVELQEKASAQVANALVGKSFDAQKKAHIEQISRAIDGAILAPNGWGARLLTEDARKLVKACIKDEVNTFLDERIKSVVDRLVREALEKQGVRVARDLAGQLETQIQEAVRSSLRGMLGGVA